MTDLEMFIVEHINDKKFKFPNDFNPSEKYSDEFYDRVREVFEKLSTFIMGKEKIRISIHKMAF